ncbi:elongation factor Ts [endosymbiont of Acanthamoeba sp. UWC8]|uniref:translation elongation factor Ts n=1 Tax=endosymbiont of Acanthamoeba sp. UWC8 TaxID=86106 RepID=UPI0004D1D99A|nr:translation elongation factor Ts [endosymbiont of Acanthamoeba sp. UWC8]AIF80569.1 elongation factor Ts [endosymbiont of Acanthamoeba sp. UWC8]
MTNINASSVKDLREKTGAGMMDCKKALTECSGDFEAAVDWLRKKGLSAAGKKADRVAAEGLIAIYTENTRGTVLELNSETDFVARNEKFQSLAKNLVRNASNFNGSVEELKSSKLKDGKTVNEEVIEHVAVIGENLSLRRFETLSVNSGAVVSYTHNAVAEGLGKIGVLVALESEAKYEDLLPVGKQIAMHIAAAKPEALNIEQLDPAKVEKEKSILSEQALASGKPKEVVEKMLEGRIRKYYEEVVLLEQVFIMDNKMKISQVIEDAGRQIGKPIKLTAFVRYALGEGIEKTAEN